MLEGGKVGEAAVGEVDEEAREIQRSQLLEGREVCEAGVGYQLAVAEVQCLQPL